MQAPISRKERAQRTQWAAQFLAASELVRRYYVVSFTMGNNTPDADLMVGTQNGGQFWVDVKGLSTNNAWLITPKQVRLNLYYILVRVGDTKDQDRFFILPQSETNKLLEKSKLAHPTDPTNGFAFRYPENFENKWEILPAARPV
jgi:hypothetical protein